MDNFWNTRVQTDPCFIPVIPCMTDCFEGQMDWGKDGEKHISALFPSPLRPEAAKGPLPQFGTDTFLSQIAGSLSKTKILHYSYECGGLEFVVTLLGETGDLKKEN